MGYLVLIRHGESRWNLKNKFTGWVDVPLSLGGIKEAQKAAKNLKGVQFDIAYSSKLVRAQETLFIILAEQGMCGVVQHQKGKQKKWGHHKNDEESSEIPVHFSEELNERYYGELQGMNKDQAREKFGEEQVFIWRRSYDVRPPKGECLKDVSKRSVKFFEKNIFTQLKDGKNVLIAAHGNSLRAIIKHLEGISDEDIPKLELPLGEPILYTCTKGNIKREHKPHTFDRPMH